MVIAFLDISDWLLWACLGGLLFCWIVQVVSAFRNRAFLLGVFSVLLTPIGGFIIGCVHAREWKITQVMVAFAGSALAIFVLYLAAMYETAP